MKESLLIIMILLFFFGVLFCFGNMLSSCVGIFMISLGVLVFVVGYFDEYGSSFWRSDLNWRCEDFITIVNEFAIAWWQSFLPEPNGKIERMIVRIQNYF